MTPTERSEHIQMLRMKYQREHRERKGHYPHEDREELYEQEIQQSLDNMKVSLLHCLRYEFSIFIFTF